MPRDEKFRMQNRRARLDEAIEGPSTKESPPPATEPEDDYEKDFDKEAKILELKKKKEELLKGISDKSEKEREKIREQLRALNDQLDELEM